MIICSLIKKTFYLQFHKSYRHENWQIVVYDFTIIIINLFYFDFDIEKNMQVVRND